MGIQLGHDDFQHRLQPEVAGEFAEVFINHILRDLKKIGVEGLFRVDLVSPLPYPEEDVLQEAVGDVFIIKEVE